MFPEYFDGRDLQKESDAMYKRAEELADVIETSYLEANVNEDTLPLFDFSINLNEAD